jgi:UDP-N-acetylglucosamine 2-epimerase (non-hydrolysing)
MTKKKILIVVGTRPEAIKMAPLIRQFRNISDVFETKVCVTAQHRSMLDQVLEFFEISPDYDLDLMKPNQDLYDLTSSIITELKAVYKDFPADFTFVHGDTTTTMAASIAAFYASSKICHIEAGLRTNNLNSPFPEEANRQLTSRLTNYHFAPTFEAKNNLLKENIPSEKIVVTGNTVIDALHFGVKKTSGSKNERISYFDELLLGYDLILVTGHRRENHGDGIINICSALKEVSKLFPRVKIIYPVHLNPKILGPVNQILGSIENIILTEPLDYQDFIWLMNRSKLIVTDSGGIQEEAPSLGKPVLVTREETERPEAVQAGTVILVGNKPERIVFEATKLLSDEVEYLRMSEINNPYGDGNASQRIVDALKKICDVE